VSGRGYAVDRLMDSFTTRFAARLNEEIEGVIIDKTAKLVTTRAVDFPDYVQRVGFIEGLKRAREIAKQIDVELNRAEDFASRAPMHTKRYEE
jgi:hypothetical protein